MPNTNVTKEEVKGKDEKKLVEDSDGRVVDLIDLLDNPSSLAPNIRRRLSALREHAKISNETIVEKYGENSTNIENLDTVNKRLLEVCKDIAKEQKKEGIVFDDNGDFDKDESVKIAVQASISDMYDMTADKINKSKSIDGFNKENDKLLENIFKEIDEKKNFKFSENAENLFRSSAFDKGSIWNGSLDNIFKDVSDVDKNKELAIMKFKLLYSEKEKGVEGSSEELELLISQYPEYSEEFSKLEKDGFNAIEFDLEKGEFAKKILDNMIDKIAGMSDQDIQNMKEEDKKQFIKQTLAILDASADTEYLKKVQVTLEKIYPGQINVLEPTEFMEQAGNILSISQDEVFALISGEATNRTFKESIDYIIKENDPIEIELRKGQIARDILDNMINKVDTMLDEDIKKIDENEKKQFIIQSLAILNTKTDSEYLEKLQVTFDKLYPGQINVLEPSGFIKQAGNILSISENELLALSSGKALDKTYKMVEGLQKNEVKPQSKLTDEEVASYFESKSVEVKDTEPTNVKRKSEETEVGNTSAAMKSIETEKNNIVEDANMEENTKPGFLNTIVKKFKQVLNRITGKQKRLPSREKIEDSDYNSSNTSASEKSGKSQEEPKAQNRNDSFVQTVQINEQAVIENMHENKKNKAVNKEDSEITL